MRGRTLNRLRNDLQPPRSRYRSNVGPMFACWSADPNLYEIVSAPGNVNLDAEAVEAANCRNGNGHGVLSVFEDGATVLPAVGYTWVS